MVPSEDYSREPPLLPGLFGVKGERPKPNIAAYKNTKNLLVPVLAGQYNIINRMSTGTKHYEKSHLDPY